MNKPAFLMVASLSAALLLSGCGFGGNVKIEAEDIEDYIDWKDDQTEVDIIPFQAAPIRVTGTGTVRAAPDIAVLTGVIKSEAKLDHKAMDASAKIINQVQEIIDGKDIDVSFTTISSAEQRDLECLAHNQKAAQRHADINADNWFNKNQLRQPEDLRQKLRAEKSRIAQKVCEVTHVENYIVFTAWVRPSGAVSDYIRSFTEAGVEKVSLFGFDFSNYDALYKEAAEKAVKNAREKANISARIAGTELTTIESFSVTGTERRRRFGQQAMLISPHGNRSAVPQQRTTFSDRVIRSQGTPRNRRYSRPAQPAPQANFTCWDGSIVLNGAYCPSQAVAMAVVSSGFSGASTSSASNDYVSPDGASSSIYETVAETVVVQEASTELVTIPATFENVTETIVVQEASAGSPAITDQITRRVVKTPASTVERVIPAVTKTVTRRVLKNGVAPKSGGGGVSAQSGASNALNESMMSGSKTIRVSATLSYNYKTPLDGVIFKVPEDE